MNIENHRCIAKLPTIAFFFEYIIYCKIVDNQHCFGQERLTATNPTEFGNYALKGLIERALIKAFDRIRNDILIRKLSNFNITSNLISWIESNHLNLFNMALQILWILTYNMICRSAAILGLPRFCSSSTVLYVRCLMCSFQSLLMISK